MFVILLMFWSFFYYTEKNSYYSQKFFVATDLSDKYNTLDDYFKINFLLDENKILNDVQIYTREGYNLEFQTWNYKETVIDIINLKAGYEKKFLTEEDEKFFENTFLVNRQKRIRLNTALKNNLIRSLLEKSSDEYHSAIIYVGFKNEKVGKIILKEFDKLISDQIEISIKNCNETVNKIKVLEKAYMTFLDKNFNQFNSEFVNYFELSKLQNYNCNNFYHINSKKVKVLRYNTPVFLMIFFLFFLLIITPLIYRINKK